jgi:pSer/pThr/pTyr-binding forkhead associated (FHA) protein
MPEAETSQFHQPLHNPPPIKLSKKSSEVSEPHEFHWLVVKDDKGRRELPLGGDLYSIGRDPDSNIRLFSLFVSRRHATLVRQQREDGNYEYQIVDGNLQGQLSANGISINGRKIQVHNLKNEDEVVFGAGVSAKYYLVKRGDGKTNSSDPFDITLIDPSMIEESDEEEVKDFRSF